MIETQKGVSATMEFADREPYFERLTAAAASKKDGEHESVLYCLEGGSRQTLPDGTVHEFRPGDAMHLPREHEYHLVGPEGVVFAVACNPSR
ncbi:hypothetical protein [Luethyella okanaganae]|uniref:N-acetyldiaminobutyrate dehydratase n=1 Tax=Luethyella okanaganae TaxID=69372 RepID=A0ABW1V985_9MICO